MNDYKITIIREPEKETCHHWSPMDREKNINNGCVEIINKNISGNLISDHFVDINKTIICPTEKIIK